MPLATELPPPSQIAGAITAAPGGTQAAATPITTGSAVLGTVATAADSVKLPPAQPGNSVTIFNNGAASAQVFGSGSDTINGAAAATGVAHAAATGAQYICLVAGKWFRLLQG